MTWYKTIFAVALAVIFVVATLVSLFAATRGASAILRTYVFNVETCEFRPMPKLVQEDEVVSPEEVEKKCSIDYNRARRDIAEGLATFLVAAPLAWVAFLFTRRELDETKRSAKRSSASGRKK